MMKNRLELADVPLRIIRRAHWCDVAKDTNFSLVKVMVNNETRMWGAYAKAVMLENTGVARMVLLEC